MNKKIVGILAISLLCLGMTQSCKKKRYSPKFTDAIITGIDYRKCMCCGGPMITFTDDPAPYSSDFKLLSNSIEELGISNSTQFPIYVSVVWEEDTSRCKGYFIKLKAHKIR